MEQQQLIKQILTTKDAAMVIEKAIEFVNLASKLN